MDGILYRRYSIPIFFYYSGWKKRKKEIAILIRQVYLWIPTSHNLLTLVLWVSFSRRQPIISTLIGSVFKTGYGADDVDQTNFGETADSLGTILYGAMALE